MAPKEAFVLPEAPAAPKSPTPNAAPSETPAPVEGKGADTHADEDHDEMLVPAGRKDGAPKESWDDEQPGQSGEGVEAAEATVPDGDSTPGSGDAGSAGDAGDGGAAAEGTIDAATIARLRAASGGNAAVFRDLLSAFLGVEVPTPAASGKPPAEAPKAQTAEEIVEEMFGVLADEKDPARERKALVRLVQKLQATNEARLEERLAAHAQKQQAESRETLAEVSFDREFPGVRKNAAERKAIQNEYVALAQEMGDPRDEGNPAYRLPAALVYRSVLHKRARANGSRAVPAAAAAQAAEKKKAPAVAAQAGIPNGKPAGPVERRELSEEERLVKKTLDVERRRTAFRLP